MKKNNHKFESNKQYFTISVYAFCVIVLSLLFYKVIGNWKATTIFIKSTLRILSPFLIAFLIAYLLYPLINWVEQNILSKVRFGKHHLSFKVKRVLSILIIYIFVIGLLILMLVYVLPQMATSIYEIFQEGSNYLDSTSQFLESFFDTLYIHYPNVDIDLIKNTLNNYLPNIYDEVRSILFNIIPFIYGLSITLVSSLINLLLALVIAFYLITEKEQFLSKSKKIFYAFLDESQATKFIEVLRDSHKIFANFVIGKALDSLIIGFLTFIILLIARMPYALLLSVIIGITNMIPYFGPFIGAIPGFLLILIINPIKAIWFAVIIFGIQQFDGLFLGPKILGDSTGLTPFWVIFSIIIGGALFGIIGMFLGVPVFAVINNLINKSIQRRLNAKNNSYSENI